MSGKGTRLEQDFIAGEDLPGRIPVWLFFERKSRADSGVTTVRRLLAGPNHVGHVVGVTLRPARAGKRVPVVIMGDVLRYPHEYPGQEAWVTEYGAVLPWAQVPNNTWAVKIGLFSQVGLWVYLDFKPKRKRG